MTEILGHDSFVCHARNDLQCAGHMIMKGPDNGFVKLAKWMGIPLKLMGEELVFGSIMDCIAHHASITRKKGN